MPSEKTEQYRNYWGRQVDRILELVNQAFEHGISDHFDVGELDDIGDRKSNNWSGYIMLSPDQEKCTRTYMRGLRDKLIDAKITKRYGNAEFKISVSNDLKLRVQLLSDPVAISAVPQLARPFSRIFEDYEEAQWAFGLLDETFHRLGITDVNDERFSLTLPHEGQILRLNFGNWAVLQFYDPNYSSEFMGMALIEDQANIEGLLNPWKPFDHGKDEPTIRVYKLTRETLWPLEGELRRAYENTFAQIANKFKNWTASPYRKYNVPEIAIAVLDPDKRIDLLTSGIAEYPRETGYFSRRTFDLLEGLHRNPTVGYYMGHRDAFEAHVMEPFKRLFYDVADSLPLQISNALETERRLFSRIPKNDFGQGGAWDFYWGAFYPKGSKRTVDAQLSLWMNYERLELGFYIGDYGTEKRKRFLQRCQAYAPELQAILQDIIPDEDIVFGPHEAYTIQPDGTVQSQFDLTWQEWLEHPDRTDFDVSIVLSKDKVLNYSEKSLVRRITRTFERLFPLVLLAIEDDPLSAIAEYIEGFDGVAMPNPLYSLTACADETHFDEHILAGWVRAIERKKQAIIYGPPGTGKTYLAERLAKHLISGGDGFLEIVQFHPAYAYEDFIQGFRPVPAVDGGLNFKRTSGRFLDFCRKAEVCDDRCVLIIDEINRANLSRVFGELMYLLEYRDREVPLAAGGTFRIPKNVRLIGTMNTADRSIALMDHALRRRFAFLPLYPDDNLYNVLRRFHQSNHTGFDVNPLIRVLKRLNQQIKNRHYYVGITFFLLSDLSQHIRDVWQMEIEPYLEEYFFDQPNKVNAFRWEIISEDIEQ